MNIKTKRFIGFICKNERDPKNLGRYKVYIPELIHTSGESQDFSHFETNYTNGFWCKNRTVSNKMTHRSSSYYRDGNEGGNKNFGDFSENFYFLSRRITYSGSYFPLQPGTLVTVIFKDNDYNTGRIIETIADSELHHTLSYGAEYGDPAEISKQTILERFKRIDDFNESRKQLMIHQISPFTGIQNSRIFRNKGKDKTEAGTAIDYQNDNGYGGIVGINEHLYPLPLNADRDHIYISHSTPNYDHSIQSFESVTEQIVPINIFSVRQLVNTNKITEYYIDQLFQDEYASVDVYGNDNKIHLSLEKLHYTILAIPENTMRITHGHGYNCVDFHQFRIYNNVNFTEQNYSGFFHPHLVETKYLIEDDFTSLPINDDNPAYILHTDDAGVIHVFSEGDLDVDVANRIWIDCMQYMRTRVGKKVFFDIGDMRSRQSLHQQYGEYTTAIQNQEKYFMALVKDNRPCNIVLRSICLGGTYDPDVPTRPTKSRIEILSECHGYDPSNNIDNGATSETIIENKTIGIDSSAKFTQNIIATGSIAEELNSQLAEKITTISTESGGANILDKTTISSEGSGSNIALSTSVITTGDKSVIDVENTTTMLGEDSTYTQTDKISTKKLRSNINSTIIYETNQIESSINYTFKLATNEIDSALIYSNDFETKLDNASITTNTNLKTDGSAANITKNENITINGAGSGYQTICNLNVQDGGITANENITAPNGTAIISKNLDVQDSITSENITTTGVYGNSKRVIASGVATDNDTIEGSTATKIIKVDSGGKTMTIEFNASGDLILSLSGGNNVTLKEDGKIISTTGTGSTVTLDGANAIIDAANITLNGNTSINGNVTVSANANLNGNVNTGSITTTGDITATGNITAPNINEI